MSGASNVWSVPNMSRPRIEPGPSASQARCKELFEQLMMLLFGTSTGPLSPYERQKIQLIENYGIYEMSGILIKRNKANKNQFFQIKISKYLSSLRRNTVLVKSNLQIHSGFYLLLVLYRIRTPEFVIYKISVADPDPSDPYVLWVS
jgi:hypothetical protein